MNNPRFLLLLALIFLGYLIWDNWQRDYAMPKPTDLAATSATGGSTVPDATTPAAATTAGAAKAPPADVPLAPGAAPPAPASETSATKADAAPHVVVTTDVLRVEIDPHGGNVVAADLLAFPQKPKDFAHPVRLLDDGAATFFAAQSGLVSAGGHAPDHQATFEAAQTSYALADGSDAMEVPLTWKDDSGVTVRKVYAFKRGSYAIEQRAEIVNGSGAPWTGNVYRQLQRTPPVVQSGGFFAFSNTERYSFIGAAFYNPADKFQKLKFDAEKYKHDKLCPARAADVSKCSAAGGWIAMLQHYFFAAWIPPADEVDTYQYGTTLVDGQTRYLIRTLSPSLTVAPGETKTETARLYVGPKDQSTLETVAPGLALTTDYGIFTIIAQPLHWALAKLHGITGNWGFAIILLVLIIKAALFKLSEAQYKSMAKMRKLQPRITALKERYGDDKQKLNAAMLELYQKEKINPLGGCLPVLVQIPVFIALYWVLLESVELRQAPFVLWIQNLSAPDPYFVLPVLNGAAMIASQMLTPTAGMDPIQAKMMKVMPVMFAVMFAFFPAGLVLYWTVNGTLTLIQQLIITRRIEAGAKA